MAVAKVASREDEDKGSEKSRSEGSPEEEGMNLIEKNKRLGRGLLVLMVSAMMPLAASAQKKTSAPAPKAPAAKPAAAPKNNTAHTNTNTSHTNTTHTNTNTTHTNTAHTNTNTGHTNTTHTNSTTTHTTTTHTNTNAGHGTTSTSRTTTTHTTTTRTANGGRSVSHADGSVHSFNSHGARTSVRTKSGAEGHFGAGGRVTSIHAHGMTINHGAHGERRFETRTRDGGRLVGFGHGRGYAEHGYMRGGHPYMRRTYFYGGRRFAYAYRGYYWHGAAFYGYVSPFYFHPAFYGWAYNPWAAPIAWGWGWGGAPWYGFYGGYFAPAPVYPSPAFWVADYLLAANLQAAYEARAAADANAAAAASAADSAPADQQAAAPAASNGPVTLTPEVKQVIADEVRAQIESEKDQAANPNPPATTSQDQVPAALDPAHRTFVVSAVLNPALPDGTECSLSPGDVLTRIQDTPDGNQNVNVLVSSQKGDCSSGAQVPVAVQDLQDMQNDFRAKIDDGLSQMAQNQGKKGMPASPSTDKTASPDGQVQADLTVGDDLKSQQQSADQTEQDVKQAASSSSGGGGGGGND